MIHAFIWLLIGYSDGAIYQLMKETEVNGYLVFLGPIFALYVGSLFFIHDLHVTARLVRRQALLVLLCITVGVFHAVTIGSFYVEGYAQLFAMVSMIFLITDLYADNADVLRPGFGRAMTIVHYVVCGYIVVSWLALRRLDLDISISYNDIRDAVDEIGARISGLHREPAWAGIAVATSYLAVLFHRPRRMLLPQLAFLAAVAATASGSGLVLAAAFVGHQISTTRSASLTIRIGLLAGLVAMTLAVFGGRIAQVLDSADASAQMRLESAIVAVNVIEESFPTGTGFGNYRNIADFDEELWRGFINLEEAEYYKSDVLALNLIAELGLFGCVVIVLLVGNFRHPGGLLTMAMFAMVLFTSGTLIIPSLLVLAAVAGLETARARAPERRPATAR